ncbi:nitrate assimilation regulatory protein nirA [Microdochium trichocladiopsis]|uniref:Nitrate assimilation regulatory protein nirA n=1 Tax=Microdochium trichocladiopsis TaxID=1682393 RepID=A0A9P9BLU8_9PEZI|nr:nitrate assimilation regulatory protein nirA [Microdochium trichocladiopsis]KAH7014447.1 nitrate assimilation regulatory protein nirA [Microdochium trichocladiopsis]
MATGRAICDDARPRCTRCVKARAECKFVKLEELKKQRAEKELAARNQSVIDLLTRGSGTNSAQALKRIREADNAEEAVSSLAEAQLLLGLPLASHETDSPYDDARFMFERGYMTSPRERYLEKDVFIDIATQDLPLSRWTTVSTDDRIMNHLLRLFFTWDNIVERTVYRPILEEDIATAESFFSDIEAGRFCSRFLINALLAASCLYTREPLTFKYLGDKQSRGRRWADEAEELLREISRPSIPLLQGLLAMFVYEGNLGSGEKSLPYFMRAMDVYRALNVVNPLPQRRHDVAQARLERERQAISWCMWGFYCCEWRGSHALGMRKCARKPKVEKEWQKPEFALRREDCVAYWWFPYPMSFDPQRSLQVEIREADVALSALAERAVDFVYPDEGGYPPTANPQLALEIYDALVQWKFSLPTRLRLEEATLPSEILLHVSLELMLVSILRPFCQMTKEQFGRFDPREKCFAHVASMMSAIWTFRAFAHLRFEYWLTHPLGTGAFIVLQEASKNDPIHMDTLVRACQCLHEMRVSLPLATDVLSGIRAAFKRSKILVPAYMDRYFEMIRHRKDGLMHHAVAALLPNPLIDRTGNAAELQLQELLDAFDDVDID